MGKASDAGRRVDYSSKAAVKYKTDFGKIVQDACAALGAAASPEVAEGAVIAAEEAGTAANPGDTARPPEQATPTVKWEPGKRVQFRDKGSNTWKWGHVTHWRPLKIDYTQHDHVRETTSSPILDAAAQRAMCFGATPEVGLGTPVGAKAPSAAAASSTPATVQSKPGGSNPKTFVVRKHTSEALPQVAHAAPSSNGRPAASKVRETDFDLEEALEASKPKAVPQPVAAVSEACAEDTAANVVVAAPPKSPAGKPKEMDKQIEFDFDFD